MEILPESIYYKVLRVDDNGLRKSAIIHPDLGGIYYPKNQWVTPVIPNSVLMVFHQYNDAKEFVDWSMISDNYLIVRCHIKESQNQLFKICSSSMNVKWFWENINEPRQPMNTVLPPQGTLFVDAVYCIE